MSIPYEIRLIAYTQHFDGTISIYDIIETSYHFAPHFARKFYRDENVKALAACKAGLNNSNWPEPRFIR